MNAFLALEAVKARTFLMLFEAGRQARQP